MVVVVVVVVLVTLYVLPGRPPASAGNVQLLWRFDFRLCIRGQAALARAGMYYTMSTLLLYLLMLWSLLTHYIV